MTTEKEAASEKEVASSSSEKPNKPKAARAERKPRKKTVKFRGEKLELPQTPPETLLFDFVEMETAEENPLAVFRMLRSLLGSEQFLAVRNKIAASNGDGPNTFEDVGQLLTDIFEQYGVTAGESQASPKS
jgi:hypothetical protein